MVDEILGHLRIPVLSGLTIGHTDDQLTLPLGVDGRLSTPTRASWSIEESGVS